MTTTGVPRANGQVERLNRTLIPLLTKLAASKPHEWYKHLDAAQLYLNATIHRSVGTPPFRVLLGVYPRVRDDPDVRRILEDELITSFDNDRDELRREAKKSIEKIQRENKAGYDRKRKEPSRYDKGDLVAIRRTRQGPGLKFSHKYLGPYEVTRVLRNHHYVLRKMGEHEGPLKTSAADLLKPWLRDHDDGGETCEEDEEDGVDEHSGRTLVQDGRV